MRYVDLVKPERVLTLHGFAAEFARDLRDRGIEAWALSEENQMELTLGKTGSGVPVAAGVSPQQAFPAATAEGKVRDGEDAASRAACAPQI